MKKLFTILFLFVSFIALSQNNGINFQGVGRNSSGAVLASTKISLRISVIQSSETGTVEYVESKEVTTNAQGIFSVVIGDGTQISKTGNFSDINWKINPKFLKVEMDPAGGSSFVAMGTTRLQAVPFAYYANGVNADNVDGVLSASKGGTGVASIASLKTALAIDQINNTSDLAKPISTATQTALDTKVSSATFSSTVATKANTSDLALKAPIDSPTFTGTVAGITKAMVGLGSVDNTSDLAKPISTLTKEALDTKVSTSVFSTTVATKANTSDLALKAPIESPTFTGTVAGITKAMVGLGSVNNTSDLAKPISTATQEALDTKVSISTFSNTVATKVSTETFSSTVATKENAANKSTATDLGAGSTSDILFPTQKAVKTYVDGQINSGGVADGGITSIKISDGAVTNEKVADGSISWRKLNIAKGDISSLGFVGDEEIIDYRAGQGLAQTTVITPNGRISGSPLVVKTFDLLPITTIRIQDEAVTDDKIATGINKSKVGLGNVENTALSTWTGSPNISSLGTINSGTWSGTNIAINKGGTGATNAADARANLGLVIGSNIQAPLTAGIDYLVPNGSAANLTSFPTLNQNTTGNATTATIAGNISATSNSTLTSLTNLNSVGTITAGTWSGTAIAINKGGTGATNAADARANLGLLIGTNIQAPLTAGVDYLAANGNALTATKLAGSKNINGVAFDGSTDITISANANTLSGTVPVSKGGTGNVTLTANHLLIGNDLNPIQTIAPGSNGNVLMSNGTNWNSTPLTAIDAGNLTGTILSSTVTESNLTSLGTITSGTWSGTNIAVNKGGTGQSSFSNGQILIGNTIGSLSKTTITAGSGISVSNGDGSITIANTAGIPNGNTAGDMLYWNGSSWIRVPPGTNGQTLTFIDNKPVWSGILASNTVVSSGKIWMDRNLGASQVATSSTDAASYGDLYQWGRGTDGHQLRSSNTTSTISNTPITGHGDFIRNSNSPMNWFNTDINNLWSGAYGVNNPCPEGFRIPTMAEWQAEIETWSSRNSIGAMNSKLKLPLAGNRTYSGVTVNLGELSSYWSSDFGNIFNVRMAKAMFFKNDFALIGDFQFAFGFSVRCIKN
jgi:uncharacterized protein (TIGR02145 family)